MTERPKIYSYGAPQRAKPDPRQTSLFLFEFNSSPAGEQHGSAMPFSTLPLWYIALFHRGTHVYTKSKHHTIHFQTYSKIWLQPRTSVVDHMINSTTQEESNSQTTKCIRNIRIKLIMTMPETKTHKIKSEK